MAVGNVCFFTKFSIPTSSLSSHRDLVRHFNAINPKSSPKNPASVYSYLFVFVDVDV